MFPALFMLFVELKGELLLVIDVADDRIFFIDH